MHYSGGCLTLDDQLAQVEASFHLGIDVLGGFWTDPLDIANAWNIDPSSPRIAVYRCTGSADEPALAFVGIEEGMSAKDESLRPML